MERESLFQIVLRRLPYTIYSPNKTLSEDQKRIYTSLKLKTAMVGCNLCNVLRSGVKIGSTKKKRLAVATIEWGARITVCPCYIAGNTRSFRNVLYKTVGGHDSPYLYIFFCTLLFTLDIRQRRWGDCTWHGITWLVQPIDRHVLC